MKDKIILWLWLKIALKDRSVKTYKTYNAFGDIEKIYNASESEYKALSFLKDDDIEALMNKPIEELKELYNHREIEK